MKPDELALAANLLPKLKREEGLQGLGPRMRIMGVIRALQWLEGKDPEAAEALAAALLPPDAPRGGASLAALVTFLEQHDVRPAVLQVHRRAFALVEAIDLTRRALEPR